MIINIRFVKRLFPGVLIIMLLAVGHAGAQELSTSSGRAVRLYQEASRQFNLLNFSEAAADLEKAVKADESFIEAYMLLGDVYKSLERENDALEVYRQALQIDSVKYPEAYFFSGLIYFDIQQYHSAIVMLEKFNGFKTINKARARDARYYLACSRFARESVGKPVPFSPENLGPGVNTANDEYINAVRSDELILYYTGRESTDRKTPGADDFYSTARESTNQAWGNSEKLGPPVNTPGDEGALSITPDGRFLLFAGCQWPGGYGSCDIFASRIRDETYEKPVNLGEAVNSPHWDSQPSLSSDGRTLYYVSSRPGGFGNSDIWTSRLQDDGSWSEPENIGGTINTYGSEMAPFIHPDGRTLYFSSDRHIGMGGIDLFMSRKDSLGNWSKPVNLGYPINTSGDEINIIVNARGNRAYISAEQLSGHGGYDIYSFELYNEIRPVSSIYMKGLVKDAEDGRPLEAFFSLTGLDSGQTIVRSFSDPSTGAFLVCIPTNREYALNVSKKGYLFYSENIALKGTATSLDPFLVNIYLDPVKTGQKAVLRNIFFETDEYSLKTKSRAELRKLVEFLSFHPDVKIEISGHTDNVGSKDYNLQLSENRAKAVYTYLLGQGINRERLQYKGYGYSQPVAKNITDKGRALNRRTEIKVIETGNL